MEDLSLSKMPTRQSCSVVAYPWVHRVIRSNSIVACLVVCPRVAADRRIREGHKRCLKYECIHKFSEMQYGRGWRSFIVTTLQGSIASSPPQGHGFLHWHKGFRG